MVVAVDAVAVVHLAAAVLVTLLYQIRNDL